MSDALILRTALGEGREVPAALQGLPTEIDGQPVKYRRKALLRAGKYLHPKHGEYVFTRADLETCAKHTREWIGDGWKPYLPPGHKAYDKALNFGWVLDPAVEGDTLFATVQLIGADAHREAARNDVSVLIRKDAVAANGKKHPLLLEHVALCPDPVAGNLGGFVPMSRDGAPPEEVPVYQMSTAAPAARKDVMKLTAEQKTKLQKLAPEGMTLGDEVPDADVWKILDHIDGKARSAETDKTAALSRATAAEGERDGLKTKVAEFSRGDKPAPQPPKATELHWARRTVEQARSKLIDGGVLSPATADKLEGRFIGTDTKVFTLSREAKAEDQRALDGMATLLDIYESLEGNEPPPKKGPAVFPMSREFEGQTDDNKPVSKERRNELREMAGLNPVA